MLFRQKGSASLHIAESDLGPWSKTSTLNDIHFELVDKIAKFNGVSDSQVMLVQGPFENFVSWILFYKGLRAVKCLSDNNYRTIPKLHSKDSFIFVDDKLPSEQVPAGVLLLVDGEQFDFEVLLNSAPKVPLELVENCILFKSFTHAFGLAQFQLGYIIGTTQVLSKIAKNYIHEQISTFSKVQALQCFENMQKYVEHAKKLQLVRKGLFSVDATGPLKNYIEIEFSSERERIHFFKWAQKYYKILVNCKVHSETTFKCFAAINLCSSEMNSLNKALTDWHTAQKFKDGHTVYAKGQKFFSKSKSFLDRLGIGLDVQWIDQVDQVDVSKSHIYVDSPSDAMLLTTDTETTFGKASFKMTLRGRDRDQSPST